jgi:hypothetical protein
MSSRLLRLVLYLYPRWWRARYGAEFTALLETTPVNLRTLVNVACSGIKERVLSVRGRDMHLTPTFGAILRRPSAFLPIAMSLTALTMVMTDLAINGIVRGGDEGAIAHIWQLLMAGQMPILLFFAVRWLPRVPGQTLKVLALQIAAALASMAPVFFLNL